MRSNGIQTNSFESLADVTQCFQLITQKLGFLPTGVHAGIITNVALKEHGCLGLSWMSARNALQGGSESFAAGAEQTPYP